MASGSTTDAFHTWLKPRLQGSLPGRDAHNQMLPEPADNSPELPRNSIDSSGHPSGVLVPIFPEDTGHLSVILTLRTDSIRHAGQISFPGGRSDTGETTVETALRETHEEIGIPASEIEVAGTLSPFYLYRTHNRITPVIGILDKKPQMERNEAEVAEIITVRLDDLLSQNSLKREKWELSNATYWVPYWDFHRVPLWGATAMMMSELLEIYREFLEE
ncbi:MAG: NUDIX domain-containing protein [Bacteroidetes bacterium]|jgi:8-oxo-dGTP pyrophosphatase MutT (NUDIX family)|nr:NUDIX domain-containing protein [Bacteroidota bacterium]